MQATFKKLNDGSWGIKVTGGTPKTGQEVSVSKKSGDRKVVKVKTVLWSSGTDAICSIASDKAAAKSAPRRGGGGYSNVRRARKSCVTGGNCSSFGAGHSCGGYDCDGW